MGSVGFTNVKANRPPTEEKSLSNIVILPKDTSQKGIEDKIANASKDQILKYNLKLLAPTPPMGWNSWNCFRADVNAEKIKAIADAMVKTGMRDAGYQYVIIDDGWMTDKRDKEGHIIVDSTKFPKGIKPVADYIHSLGLKFGIYSSPGRYTCQRLMGSLGHEQMDANDYAAWGVDYLKYDQCSYKKSDNESIQAYKKRCRAAYQLMGDCLKKTGRQIIYSTHDKCSVSSGGVVSLNGDLPWIKGVANMHRTSNDIKDNWNRMLYCLETTADLWSYAGPGYWNDPDMLEVGNTSNEKLWGKISDRKMNLTEYRTHFSMWCMVAAPLIAGNDLRSMKPDIVRILTNKEIIAIDQDPLGIQGRKLIEKEADHKEIWVKKLTNNRLAVALLNKADEPTTIKMTWKELNIKGERKLRDLWKHKNLGSFKGTFESDKIPSHGVMVLLMEE